MRNLLNLGDMIYEEYRWKKDSKDNGDITFTRVGRHLVHPDTEKYGRWISIPFEKKLKRNASYTLYAELKCNYEKNGVRVFLSNKNDEIQQIVSFDLSENEREQVRADFVPCIEGGDHLVITATDFPISGEILTIGGMEVIKEH